MERKDASYAQTQKFFTREKQAKLLIIFKKDPQIAEAESIKQSL